MSGILSQVGVAAEIISPPAVTAGAATAGVPNTAQLTFGSAHGLRVGDVITLTGATPAGWNGTWTIASVPLTTTATFVTPTLLATPTTVQPTIVSTGWASLTTPTRFFEFNSEAIKLDVKRIESKGMRKSNRVLRNDRFAINRIGAGGPLSMEVQTKGFGYWLKHMLGIVTTVGPTDTTYAHTGTIGSLQGLGLTVQVGRPFAGSTAVQPFTYNGAKVVSWALHNDVDGILGLDLTFDANDETMATALAVASYPTGTELLTFTGGTVSIGGTSFDVVSKVSVTGDNKLAPNRRFIRASQLAKEPLEENFRDYKATFDAEFQSVAQYNRVVSLTAAGALASVVLTWSGPTLAGASTYPSLTVTMPAFRFDGDSPVVNGPGLVMQPVSGVALNTNGGTDDAISIAYVTLDTTP